MFVSIYSKDQEKVLTKVHFPFQSGHVWEEVNDPNDEDRDYNRGCEKDNQCEEKEQGRSIGIHCWGGGREYLKPETVQAREGRQSNIITITEVI